MATALTAPPVRRIDEARLENDLGCVAEFMGFGPEDVAAIHGAAPHLAPLVPALVDAVYDKLFGCDAAKRRFVPQQSGYEGETPADLDALTRDHEQIQYRKCRLGAYLKRLVAAAYDGRMVSYLDFVGQMHTPKAGSPDIVVPLVQMNALMDFVSDALLATVVGLDLDAETKAQTLRAFNKRLWLQNDLVTPHCTA